MKALITILLLLTTVDALAGNSQIGSSSKNIPVTLENGEKGTLSYDELVKAMRSQAKASAGSENGFYILPDGNLEFPNPKLGSRSFVSTSAQSFGDGATWAAEAFCRLQGASFYSSYQLSSKVSINSSTVALSISNQQPSIYEKADPAKLAQGIYKSFDSIICVP